MGTAHEDERGNGHAGPPNAPAGAADNGRADGGADAPVILVGFSGAWLAALAKFQPEHTIILVEEPDVVRKRTLREAAAESVILRELIEWEFHLDAAADCFFQRHRHLRPAAVVPVGDYSVPFAARLAELYGVVGAGFGAALLLRDKELCRRVTAAAGIPNPRSVAVRSPDEVRALLAEVGAVVLKPANRQGALGTRVLRDPDEVDAAWAECTEQDEGVYAPDRRMPLRMLAERFVAGDEFSVELMVRGGRTHFASVTRKFLFPGPRPVERGHLVPADIGDDLRARLVGATERVVGAVGMDTGFVHCEWIVTADGTPYLVECAGRLAGGGIMDLIVLAWDYDVFGQYWDLMHGRELAAAPTTVTCHGAVWLSAEPPGEVESVSGVEDAEALPGVHAVGVAVGPGDRVTELRSSWDRVAMAIATGETPEIALGTARTAIELIEVKVRPPVRL
ncbi:MAG TPA: ATP-grasp domain-containing protein [Pseudonocardiaceae bacterium]